MHTTEISVVVQAGNLSVTGSGLALNINHNTIVGNPNQGIPFGNPQWITSGAAIGDESVHNYSMLRRKNRKRTQLKFAKATTEF